MLFEEKDCTRELHFELLLHCRCNFFSLTGKDSFVLTARLFLLKYGRCNEIAYFVPSGYRQIEVISIAVQPAVKLELGKCRIYLRLIMFLNIDK